VIADPKPESRYVADADEWDEIRDSFAGSSCQVCGAWWNRFRDHLHHIVHRSQRGSDVHENLAPLCSDCHALVHAHDMRTRARFAASLSTAQRVYALRVKGPGWLDRYMPGWKDGAS
jgi:5-methylcytosine-specific restriction endonuclease McrA